MSTIRVYDSHGFCDGFCNVDEDEEAAVLEFLRHTGRPYTVHDDDKLVEWCDPDHVLPLHVTAPEPLDVRTSTVHRLQRLHVIVSAIEPSAN